MNQVDRRKYPRFLVADNALAVLTKSKLGKIRDISRGGIFFSYINYEDEDSVTERKSSEVSIIHDPGFCLFHLPCKVIKDEYYPSDHHGLLKMKKCRIQFYYLTPDQEAQLQNFIKNFAIGSSRGSPLMMKSAAGIRH
jgi:hypothetical protein